MVQEKNSQGAIGLRDTRRLRAADQPVLPVLYSFRRCPYAIRARLALHVAGIEVEIREVALRDKPDALRQLSPKATVPVLQLGDGHILHESLEILVWALQHRDPHDWLATLHRPDLQQWVLRNDTAFKPLLDGYKYAERNLELSRERHRDKAVDGFLTPLDLALRTHGFLGGVDAGWADLALFPFVRQFAMVEPEWFAAQPAFQALHRWLTFWTDSEWFAAVMVKRPVWIEPAPDRSSTIHKKVK